MVRRYISVDFRDTTSLWDQLAKLNISNAGSIVLNLMEPALVTKIQDMDYNVASEWSSILLDILGAKEYADCPKNTSNTKYIDVTEAHNYLNNIRMPFWRAACGGVNDLFIKNATSLDWALPSGTKNFQFEAGGCTFVNVEFSNFKNISTVRSIFSGYDPRRNPTMLSKFKCDTKLSIRSHYLGLSHLELSLDPQNFYVASYFGDYFSARLFGKDLASSDYIDLSALFYKYAQEQCPE
jgi:hypothetical protein